MQEMTHRHTRELDVFYNEHRDACTNCGRRFQNGMCAHLGYDAERNPVVLCDDPLVHYRMDIRLYSYSGLHGQIRRTPQMPWMYTGNPDRCAGSVPL